MLCANAPETKDNDFTWKDFADRVNNELVASFRQLLKPHFRVDAQTLRRKVPPLHTDILTKEDKDMLAEFDNAKGNVEAYLEQFRFRMHWRK